MPERASSRDRGNGVPGSVSAVTRPSWTMIRLAHPASDSFCGTLPQILSRTSSLAMERPAKARSAPARLVPGTYRRDRPSRASARSTDGSPPRPPTCSGVSSRSQPRTRRRRTIGRPVRAAGVSTFGWLISSRPRGCRRGWLWPGGARPCAVRGLAVRGPAVRGQAGRDQRANGFGPQFGVGTQPVGPAVSHD